MKYPTAKLAKRQSGIDPQLGAMLDQVCDLNEVVEKTIVVSGKDTIRSYLKSILCHTDEPAQHRHDFITAAVGYARKTYGDSSATDLRQVLERQPVVLTTNHHGVDYFSQSVQGTLMMSLSDIDGDRPPVVPVLACANIPVNNLTYPQGVLSYSPGHSAVDRFPYRLPLIPNSRRPELVLCTEGIRSQDVHRALANARRQIRAGVISEDVGEVLTGLLEEVYLDDDVLAQKKYVDQAGLINREIWHRAFGESKDVPEPLYIPIETISANLISRDLYDKSSIMWRLLFDPVVRRRALSNLADIPGCWTSYVTSNLDARHNRNAGTFFFWGVCENKKRVPLRYEERGTEAVLSGRLPDGSGICLSLQPDVVIDEMAAGRIVPSLLSCFTAIALARGITCLGGYYQAAYLPRMAAGVEASLDIDDVPPQIMTGISRVPTTGYLSGMQGVMHESRDGGLLPSGMLEIIARGGLDVRDQERLRELTVGNCHIASLVETLPDFGVTPSAGPWWRDFSLLLAKELKDRVVVI